MDIQITVTGMEEAKAKLTNFARKFPLQVAAALSDEADEIMTESKSEVPIDTGSLKDSGFVDPPTISGNNISVKLGYGGKHVQVNPKTGQLTTIYAIIVHEDTQTNHARGKAKYLIDPINRRKDQMLDRLNQAILRLL